ncbi:hypothetical protein RchiOBHm_Chr2g0159851 [Rosa chinensis]|uniref:Uncharacterized protein n=1 Tax=Rosa chinensis TaxID=74649 RepID=A0A2P6S2C3_ROSCH|nr:hypothetical protein RchiOBHm_Chr2g0159851 [Rosa chinensis]
MLTFYPENKKNKPRSGQRPNLRFALLFISFLMFFFASRNLLCSSLLFIDSLEAWSLELGAWIFNF